MITGEHIDNDGSGMSFKLLRINQTYLCAQNPEKTIIRLQVLCD